MPNEVWSIWTHFLIFKNFFCQLPFGKKIQLGKMSNECKEMVNKMTTFVISSVTVQYCNVLFGLFGLSKEPYTIMLCSSSLALLVSSSVHTSPWHRVRHRNFTFGILMHICPPIYAHQIFS